jgi:transketolase
MRKTFAKEIERRALNDDKLVFITGDLGFNAFENLQEILGDRFINAGVAEQNMIGVAAGLASKGFRVYVYSIAPFLVYRALEQIRNDLCFHQLPVCLVGNGGGYGYGIMGSTHHALSDVATLGALPNMEVFVPAFDNDVSMHLDAIEKRQLPSYLRLGYAPEQMVYQDYHSTQQIHKAKQVKVSLIFMGPLIHQLLEHSEWKDVSDHVDLFSIQQFPITQLDDTLALSLQQSKRIVVAEEHDKTGGLGQQLSALILANSIQLDKSLFRFALGYPDQLYGSQSYHQSQSGLDADSLISDLKKLLQDD